MVAKCSICGAPAVAYVGYQRKHLCSTHYVWLVENKVRRALRRYKMASRGDTLLVAISGGKDSAATLGALTKLSSEFGYRVIALYIDLGIGEYSKKSREAAVKLASQLGIPLIIVDLKEAIGATIPELARLSKRPVCSVCGLVKRYVTNAVAVEIRASALALGHNADDLAVYNLKSFMNQDLEAISKLGPKTEGIEGVAVGRIRPLYEVYEKEAFLYAFLTGLPFIHDECPYVDTRSIERKLKESLNAIESEKPGTKIMMVRGLAKRIRDYPKPKGGIRRCRICGLLASGEICSFCRLTSKILGEAKGPRLRKYVSRLAAELKPTA